MEPESEGKDAQIDVKAEPKQAQRGQKEELEGDNFSNFSQDFVHEQK